MHVRPIHRLIIAGPAAALAVAGLTLPGPALAQREVSGPPGSGQFGSQIEILDGGTIVVVDPEYDVPSGPLNVGAIHVYAEDGALQARFTGTTANDRVGSGGIVRISGDSVVVFSPEWTNGEQTSAGALTYITAATNGSGPVGPDNSLVGTRNDDLSAATSAGTTVDALPNGDYVVAAPSWDNGPVLNVGAVLLCRAGTGCVGQISPSNALVGSRENDRVGNRGTIADSGVRPLTNSNFFVISRDWDNGESQPDVGAVTFVANATPLTGPVSAANSLHGTAAFDLASAGGTALRNGHFVLRAPLWDDGTTLNVGLATWIDGTTGRTGPLTAAGSIIGGQANTNVGSAETVALTNGNYVVRSPGWDSGAIQNLGAATFAIGTAPTTAVVSAANSLVGAATGDATASGTFGVVALANGNYVVRTGNFDVGTVSNVGAVTWASGVTGLSGAVSTSNSLVGATANDLIGGSAIVPLSDGNYLVASATWDNGTVVNAGAVTWGDGASGTTGVVSTTNSIVGSTATDQVGGGNIWALPGGAYVIGGSRWDNGPLVDAGFAMVVDGGAPSTLPINATNALVGGSANDRVGGVVTLAAPDVVVVRATGLDNGTIADAGGVSVFRVGAEPAGVMDAGNALLGTSDAENAGSAGTVVFGADRIAIATPGHDLGLVENVGAVTLGDVDDPPTGPITATNSLIGATAESGAGPIRALGNLAVYGRPGANQIVIIGADRIFADGFEASKP
ncbi:MAG: hypothetical protein QN159_13190 [Armatimonadota bacterium]|nr:hypothetical protein [Armatimonadota bacterium]